MLSTFSVKDSEKWKNADKTENEIAWCLAAKWMQEMEGLIEYGEISHSSIDKCLGIAEKETITFLWLSNGVSPMQINDAKKIIIEHWEFGNNLAKTRIVEGARP